MLFNMINVYSVMNQLNDNFLIYLSLAEFDFTHEIECDIDNAKQRTNTYVRFALLIS